MNGRTSGIATELLARTRGAKQALIGGGSLKRSLIPVTDAVEVWLTEGFREVVFRAKRRILRQPAMMPAIRAQLARSGGLRSSLAIPTLRVQGGVSIIIPVLDNATLTLNCLQSIVDHSPEGGYEVIAVDNGSASATRDALARIRGLRLIRNEMNDGFVAACNQGARIAHGEFLLFLNNDTLALPGWLDALRSTFDRDSRIGAAGAKLLYPDGRLQEAGGIIWSDGSGWNYGRNHDPDAPEYSYVRDVDYCSGACLIVRRHLFEELGGFDWRFSPAYYEDVDLCFRLRERGYRVCYQPAAQIVHFEGATAGTDTTSGAKRYQVINQRKFVQRHAAALAVQQARDPQRLSAACERQTGKRILVIDHMVPHHDHDAGSVRMTAMLRILIELGHHVTFLPDNLARLEPYAGQLQQLGVQVLYGSMSATEYLEEHLAEFEVAILCRARFAAKYLPTILASRQRPFVIFDTVDLHHLREQRRAALSQDPDDADRAVTARIEEMSVIQASDMVWVTSTHEAEMLRAYDARLPVDIVPLIHDTRHDIPGFADRRDLLFIGGFRHPPNEDAVLYFVRDILPMVRRELPDVKFRIVGSHVPAKILELADSGVEVVGHVKDVEPVFDSVRLSVAPLRYGAGVKGKISQSLALGVPVVATPIGAEGMHLEDREQLMIADDPEEFARRVVEVYRDEAVWTRLSRAGRAHVQAHLGYESARTKLEELLRRAIRPPTESGASSPRVMSDVVYSRGFSTPEHQNGSTWRWMGREGLIRLRNTQRDMLLTIHGQTPPQLAEAPSILIELAGEPLDLIVEAREVERRFEISAARQGIGESSELRIITNRTLVPREIDPGSADQRRLGFSLSGLSWEPK